MLERNYSKTRDPLPEEAEAVAARDPLPGEAKPVAARDPLLGEAKTKVAELESGKVAEAGDSRHSLGWFSRQHSLGWLNLEILREIITGHPQSGRQPLPVWWKRKVIGVVFLLLFLVGAAVAFIISGMLRLGRGKAAGEDCIPRTMSLASLKTSMKGVAESRQEVLRCIIDASLRRSEADLSDGPDKLLSQIFNEITDRIRSLSKTNFLGDGVEPVLESALTINQELLDNGCSASERQQLLLDLIGGVLNAIPQVASQMRLLDSFMEGTQQQIRALIQEKAMPDRVIADLDAAKETDGLLRQRFHDLKMSSKAAQCALGVRGWLGGFSFFG